MNEHKENYTSRKHWIAYVCPIYGIMQGLLFILIGASGGLNTLFEYFFLILGIGILLLSLNAFWRIKSCRWILVEGELIIKTGFLPWRKSHFEIPMEDIYETYVSYGFFGKLFGYAQLTIRRTEGVTSRFSSTMMANYTTVMLKINSDVKKLKKLSKQVQAVSATSNISVSDELLKLNELLRNGIINQEEFAVLKQSLVQKHS